MPQPTIRVEQTRYLAQHRLKIEETSTNNEKQLYKIYLYLVVTSLKATLFIVSVTTEAWLIDFFVLGAI